MSGYAVIDVQTTGLEASRQHRVVEIAVVLVDDDGTPGTSWTTLVNPQRDVGASDLHGVTARDVLDAPTFADLAPLLIESLVGRTPVAHNASFTLDFVSAELDRAGLGAASALTGLATMRYMHHLDPRAPRRLVDCCDEFGIPLARRYSSAHQAGAVAALLQKLITGVPSPVPWMSIILRTRNFQWPSVRESLPVRFCGRGDAVGVATNSWLDGLMTRMPSSGDPDTEAYLDLLEMALLDRYLSAHEADALVALARRLGLDREAAGSLHRDYLAAMARVAWEDRVITETEYADLAAVADALGMALRDVDAALDAARQQAANGGRPVSTFSLAPGDAVCLTGTMAVPRSELETTARGKGLVVGSLNKQTKLLVAADPDSLSGKARKARDYGVPIVNEDCFIHLVAAM